MASATNNTSPKIPRTNQGRPASSVEKNKSKTAAAQFVRSRTFIGCRTCRARHLKCDEVRPVCGLCRRLNVPCEGPEACLQWVNEVSNNGDGTSLGSSASTKKGNVDSHRATSLRFQFCSEKERSDMSTRIRQSLGQQSASEVLFSLDNDGPFNDARQVGPFGVFGLIRAPEAAPKTTAIQTTRALVHGQEEQGLAAESPTTAEVPGVIDLQACDVVELDSVFNQHHSERQIMAEPWEEDLLHAAFSTPATLPTTFAWIPPPGMPDLTGFPSCALLPPLNLGFDAPVSTPSFTSDWNFMASLDSSVSQAGFRLPQHAKTLLRYYKGNVGGGKNMPGNPTRIAPWMDILLPCALETYAEVSLWGTSSHRRLSILYTMLAKSAFHMHQLETARDKHSSEWLNIGRKYHRDAQDHLKKTFQSEISDMPESKYDEILMAILSLSLVSLLFGRYESTKALLLDGERLIRLHGLSLPKCFRQRVLHHMYTHFRVLAESIGFDSSRTSDLTLTHDIAVESSLSTKSAVANSSQQQQQQQQQKQQQVPEMSSPAPASMASSSLDPPCTNSKGEPVDLPLRGFRLAADRLGDLDIAREKPAAIAYADIHLEISGHWSESFYVDIYGIPESLMTLLSQTVSLANDKKQLEKLANTNTSVSAGLKQHTTTLEQNIWNWTAPKSRTNMPIGPARPPQVNFGPIPGSASSAIFSEPGENGSKGCANQSLLDFPDARSLTLAMHQSLLIYFYRFVHCVSSLAVQHHVRQALEHVASGMTSRVMQNQDLATSVGWAIFVAACEATEPQLQDKARSLLECIDNAGIVFIGSCQPSELAQRVWTQREHTGDWSLSWRDLSSQHQV